MKQKSPYKAVAFADDVKVTISGIKTLKEKGYEVVSDPREDFDLLIIGALKYSQRLMIAILKNKEVRSQKWLFNNKRTEI